MAMLVSLSRTPTWRPKQDSLWQYTISTPVDLVLLQIILKVRPHFFYFMVYGFFFNKVKVGGGKKIKIKV